MKTSLTGLMPEEIAAIIPPGREKFRGMQLFRWIHERGMESFDEMSNIPKAFREELTERFTIGTLRLLEVQSSADRSTDKFLWELADNARIESVIIRDEDRRVTACISSQVGCRMGCVFCRTGKMGFVRDLTAGEIVEQIIRMRMRLRAAGEDITNIVFMGMGEPMDNLDAVNRTIEIINSEVGISISQRKITVSTSGVLPGIHRLIANFHKIGLAISLNAASDVVRSRLMPVNRRWPIADILRTVRGYHHETGRRATFEYILMAGVNDSPEDARVLAAIARSVPSKVNLIGFNEFEGCDIRRPSDKVIDTFRNILIDSNVTAMLRKSKGSDILAACGQLAARKDI